MNMSPELETLDQLLGGDLALSIVRGLFPDAERFRRGITAMLDTGEVTLLDSDALTVPRWKHAEILSQPAGHPELQSHRISLTDAGAARIG